jgi:hypothetical protein
LIIDKSSTSLLGLVRDFLGHDAFLDQQFLQLAALVHVVEDIGSADKLAVYVDLWDCGPVAVSREI